MLGRRTLALFIITVTMMSTRVHAQNARWTFFPEQEIFSGPIADQRQPRTHVTWQAYRRGEQELSIGSVGYGMDWRLVGRTSTHNGMQIGVDGAVFAIFNLESDSMDLINADYYVGIPFDFRHREWSARVRPFHLSSHLGDEFLLYPQPREPVERINVSYEAVELLLSWEQGAWRLYAGGYSAFRSTDGVLEDRLQAGAEYRGPRLGRLGARWIAAADVQQSRDDQDRPDVSIKSGLELIQPGKTHGLQILLEYYDGRAPHGQFRREEEVQYLGAGIVFVF